MIKNIWEPLGITDMTFFLRDRPDVRARLAAMSTRISPDSPLECASSHPILYPDPNTKDAQGGVGIFTSGPEYFKILRALLAATEPSTASRTGIKTSELLETSTIRDFFTPQLSGASLAALQKAADSPFLNHTIAEGPGTQVNWGLGGLLYLEDLPGWRQKGTMIWGGLPNLSWVSFAANRPSLPASYRSG